MAASGKESLKVLNAWRSTFGMRVLIALKEKGLHYEYQEEDYKVHGKSQLLLESNPIHKKIPVLLHNSKPICESLIIVQYIDEAWPSPHPFLPSDPYDRALARFWADYVDKKVFDPAVGIILNAEGSDAMEQCKRDLIEVFVTLDGALRDVFGGGPYFGGKHIGLVDIVLAPFVCYFQTLETIGSFKIVDESKCPHLLVWTQSVMEYPSVKEALSIAPNQKLLESVLEQRKTLRV